MELLRKYAYVWIEIATNSFEKMKLALANIPILALPDFAKPFEVYTDASGGGMGAVLSQGNRPIAYYSKKFSWRQYLVGIDTSLYTKIDHQPLKSPLSKNIQTPEQQHWVASKTLMGYDFDILYKPGKDNVSFDVLSRYELDEMLSL